MVSRIKMHLCLTVECITSGLHLSVFLIRSQPPNRRHANPPKGAGELGANHVCGTVCESVGFKDERVHETNVFFGARDSITYFRRCLR